MAKFISETMIALRLVWLRVLLYFLVPFLTVLISQTETWSGETWEQTHWFIKTRIIVIAFLAGISSFVAFLDQSIARAREELAKKKKKHDEAVVQAEEEA